jgi:hypothetical protein
LKVANSTCTRWPIADLAALDAHQLRHQARALVELDQPIGLGWSNGGTSG